MDKEFIQAFLEVIREQIDQKHNINVEGLGVFKSSHQKQFQQRFDDGRVVMMPPKDHITFIPDKNKSK